MRNSVTVFCLAGLLAVGAQAQITSSWNKTTIAVFNWTDTANWNNGVPNGAGDVALVTPANTGWGAGQTINLGQSITLSRLDLANGYYASRTLAPNGGNLIFNTASGAATFNQATYNRCDTFSAPITLNTNLVLTSTSRAENGYGSDILQMSLNITGAIDGPGGITKKGSGMVWLSSVNNPFSGPLAIEEGWLYAANIASLGASSSPVVMGSTGRLGGLLWGGAQTFNREIVLAGAGARLTAGVAMNLGNIVSGTGALVVYRGERSSTASVNFNFAADNTYVGPTVVTGGKLEANVSNRVIPGDVVVRDGGRLTLLDANNVGGSVAMSRHELGALVTSVPSYVRVKADFIPNFTPDSEGVFEWVGSSGPNINAALAAGPLGNGYVAYGGGGTFTGAALAPNLDNVYRFALQSEAGSPGGNLTLDRTGSAEGVLTGNRSVIVSAPSAPHGMWSAGYELILLDANDFTGSITVHPGVQMRGYAQTVAGKSPFGDAGGAVHLAGSKFGFYGENNGKAVSKGELTIRGQVWLYVYQGWNTQHELIFNRLTRLNRATMGISGSLPMGGKERLSILSDAPVPDARNMIAPWMVEYSGASFLTYDGGLGFVPLAPTSTDLATAGEADIVHAAGGAVSGTKTVHALRTTGALTSAGPGDVLTITSGGLILVAASATLDHSANINFGTAEGVLFSNSSYGNRFNGKLSGSNGLTIGAPHRGNSASLFLFNPPEDSTLSGTLTINQGQVYVSGKAVAGFSEIALHGGRNASEGASQTSSLGPWGTGDQTIPASVTITLGPEGGTIKNEWNGGLSGNLIIDGRLTGGTLIVGSGNNARTLYLNSSLNDYTGGTYVFGGPVYVGVNGKLGTGDVIIGGTRATYGALLARLVARGTDNIADDARVIFAGASRVDADSLMIESASETIGSLEGYGTVFFNRSGGSVLTLGGNNASTDFYGTLSDLHTCPGYSAYTGRVIKKGTGTFTLWGEGRHGGGTQVDEGTLLLLGALDEATSVEAAGTLGGTGLVAADLTLAGGAVMPGTRNTVGTLTVTGNVTADTDATLSVNLDEGDANGVLAVTGAVTLDAVNVEVNLLNGYTPPPGGEWTILTAAGGVSGTLGEVSVGFKARIVNGNRVVLDHPPTGTMVIIR